MYLETSELRSFIVLATELHFGRTSQRLFLSQPALSKQIRKLENKIGGALFLRTRRKVELTEAGRVLLSHAERVLQDMEKAMTVTKQAVGGFAGTLRLGFGIASVFEILPRTIVAFRKLRPSVELQMREMSTPSQIDSLVDGRIDVGILRLPIARPELDSRLLIRERFVAVTPKYFEYRNRKGLGCLHEAPFILTDRSASATFHDRTLELCRRAGFAPHVVQESSEIFTILNLVRAGVGVSLVPSAAKGMKVKGISFHELRQAEAEWPIGIAWSRFSEKLDLISRFTALALSVAQRYSPSSLL